KAIPSLQANQANFFTSAQFDTLVTVHALREVWAGAHPRAT
ncbi:hypothetical protein, partial [Mycobacterium gordonae]